MSEPVANERTFQGMLGSFINRILNEDESSKFKIATQEENIGVSESRFADLLLYSKVDAGVKTGFELKNTSWDATDEILVKDAMTKAFHAGMKFFVTGTPRQLVIFETFRPNTSIHERRLKIYPLSNVRKDDDVKSPLYEKQVYPKLKVFLKELESVVHEEKTVQWDTIDKFFVNKLSAYILEASAETFESVYDRAQEDNDFKIRLRQYLTEQDIFNVSFAFNPEDIYNICQLANYLLYLKLVFYSYLQRDVPDLKLKVLEIPEETKILNKVLRQYFDDVLKHDFDLIFKKSVLDEFEFNQRYVPVLKRNVDQIRHLNFHDLSCDIVGAIYNTLIDNQEQHDRGQHFTNTNEVDIVNAFCINESTRYVMDSGCGAGTFLVRAYSLMKSFNPTLTHSQLLERLWGVEIAPFPAFLATMNLSLLNIAALENYPVIIQSDFSDVKESAAYKLFFKNESHLFKTKRLDERHSEVEIPLFDACIGNPPYIRQERITGKIKWNNLAKVEWNIDKINQQCDLFVYYLMHTSSFLKVGGWFGYVISDSWLDVSFGRDLQKFILDHFKIIAIISHSTTRSFETASITTAILILQKNKIPVERQSNSVRFVKVHKEYDEIFGSDKQDKRWTTINKFIKNIIDAKTGVYADYSVFVRNQGELEKDSTIGGKYQNGHWGAKYFRTPPVYNKIIEKAGDKLIALSAIVEIKRGFTTGANEFFYVIDETERAKLLSEEEYKLHFGITRDKHKIDWRTYGWYYSEMTKNHHVMERRYFKPLFKTQKEAVNLNVEKGNLKYKVLVCNEQKATLRKFKDKIAEYISEAESPRNQINTRPSCYSRISPEKEKDWFHLGEDLFVGDFIFPSKIGEYYRLIDNREAKVYCDKVNYNIKIKKRYEDYSDIIFLMLNSITFRFFIDLFARQMVVKISDVDVNVVERTFIVKPELFQERKRELSSIMKSLKNREQGTIYEEIKQQDRRALDTIIFEAIGLNASDVDDLYKEACLYVKQRSEKSDSMVTKKVKKKLTHEESVKLIKERFPEIRRYDTLISKIPTSLFTIPNLEPKFLNDTKTGPSNLFNKYPVFFKDNVRQITVNFANPEQVQLYHWLWNTLQVKDTKLKLPDDPELCQKVLRSLMKDFNSYCDQVASVLKTFRSKANALSVYKDVILESM